MGQTIKRLTDEPISTWEGSLRPKTLQGYHGQTVAKEHLQVFLQAAKQRQTVLDHVLLSGPPGLGKTTMAQIIAHELGCSISQTSGPVLDKAGDLASLLSNLEPHAVLFIDEIHRLSPAIEELLYSAMEDFCLDIMIGEGPAARSIQIQLNPFCLVGATTRTGLLTAPLRDRFGIHLRLQFYPADELGLILLQSAEKLGIDLPSAAAWEIAKRSRGTPRIANRLLKRVRDYADVHYRGKIDVDIAKQSLSWLAVDDHGLDEQDRELLRVLIERFDGGPVGVDTIAALLGESTGTVEEVIEPFLLQQGYLCRTARGRTVSKPSYSLLGLALPNEDK